MAVCVLLAELEGIALWLLWRFRKHIYIVIKSVWPSASDFLCLRASFHYLQVDGTADITEKTKMWKSMDDFFCYCCYFLIYFYSFIKKTYRLLLRLGSVIYQPKKHEDYYSNFYIERHTRRKHSKNYMIHESKENMSFVSKLVSLAYYIKLGNILYQHLILKIQLKQ